MIDGFELMFFIVPVKIKNTGQFCVGIFLCYRAGKHKKGDRGRGNGNGKKSEKRRCRTRDPAWGGMTREWLLMANGENLWNLWIKKSVDKG